MKTPTPQELQALCEEIIASPQFKVEGLGNFISISQKDRGLHLFVIRRKRLSWFSYLYRVQTPIQLILVSDPARLFKLAHRRALIDAIAEINNKTIKVFNAAKEELTRKSPWHQNKKTRTSIGSKPENTLTAPRA